MKRTITIIGSGMMGSALAFPAFENGNEVRLVGTPLDKEIIEECKRSGKHPKFDRPFPKGVEYFQFEDWQEAVKGADFVIGGVSSFGVDWFLNEVLAYLDPAMPVLSVTKGLINLEDGTLISYPAYWKTELLKKGIRREVNAIGGPCTSYELVFHDQTEVAFCGKDTAVIKMMKEAMQTSYYHISTTNDVIGLESAVALKNAYALGIALTIGLVNRQHGAGRSPLQLTGRGILSGHKGDDQASETPRSRRGQHGPRNRRPLRHGVRWKDQKDRHSSG